MFEDPEANQQQVTPRTGSVGQQPESDARILGVDNIEKARNHVQRPIPQADVGFDNPFGDAIQQNHARR